MIYDLIAPIYDEVNRDIDYSAWADFVDRIIKKEGAEKTSLVLDLGCGTGSMTFALAKLGYDMTGVDSSAEMLDIARKRREEICSDKDILWLCQDMTELELYGTVEAVVSTLDCINHLTSDDEVKKCFSLVHNYLSPDGLFIFDINGKYKFENIYSDMTYAMEENGSVCIWQNDYDKESGLCDFYITLFKEGNDGKYTRYDDEQTERMYTVEQMKSYLVSSGFEFLGAYSDFEFSCGHDGCERIYFVARCKK